MNVKTIIISFILVITMILVPISAKAKNIENGETPEYNTVCGNRSYHTMVSSGFGFVILPNGTTYINCKSAWQCKYCKLVMVTEGDMYYDSSKGTAVMTTIGRYATKRTWSKINNDGCVIENPDSYAYCSSNSLSGYKFYLNY